MINVFGSKVGEAEIRYVTESMRRQWMGMGPNVREFEARFARRLSLDNFLMVDSGSNALYLAVKLLDLPPASEVIVPSFTWVSCAQAVLLAGLKPVFCDVELDTMNVSAETVSAQITERTAAIMVVHYAGLPVEIDEIAALGYPLIEDAAHAVDSRSAGRACGGIADVGIYSFDAVKNLAVGEGGGLACRDPERFGRAARLRYCGIEKSGFDAAADGKSRWWEYRISDAFIKMNPSDIAAGIGLGQLESLDELQSRRRRVWEFYQRELGAVEEIVTPQEARAGDRHSFFTYSIRVPERDALAGFLKEREIYTTLRYHPLHMNAIYGQTDKRLPSCERLNEEALSIPLHPGMTLEDAASVVAGITDFLDSRVRRPRVRHKRNPRIATRSAEGRENGYLVPILNRHEDFVRDAQWPRQVYLTVSQPGEVKGPHLHFKRWGLFTCVKGNVKIVVRIDGRYEEHFSGESHGHRTVQVPAGVPAALVTLGDEPAYTLNMPSPAWQADDRDDWDVAFDDYDFGTAARPPLAEAV